MRGLDAEATLVASRAANNEAKEAIARMLKLRRDAMLPATLTIEDLIREGRA